jgi:hypothetical protein
MDEFNVGDIVDFNGAEGKVVCKCGGKVTVKFSDSTMTFLSDGRMFDSQEYPVLDLIEAAPEMTTCFINVYASMLDPDAGHAKAKDAYEKAKKYGALAVVIDPVTGKYHNVYRSMVADRKRWSTEDKANEKASKNRIALVRWTHSEKWDA